MADQQGQIEFTDARGGRNGRDWEFKLQPNQVAEAINVDFSNTNFARKRGGVAKQAFTGATFTNPVYGLWRHVPGTDETLAELWAVDGNGVVNRLAGGTAWAAPILTDAITGYDFDVQGISFNGKFFLAYASAQPRLHVYDPAALGGARVRRVGLATPGPATITDQGVGAYAAVLRYYRVRVAVQAAGVTVRRSEPSSSMAFTPSGGGASARVTMSLGVSEGETHWEVEASTDNAFFFLIATVAWATTTYDDSAATTTYLNNPASPVLNTYALPVSAKFIAADQSRLLLFGDFTAANQQNRVYFTPVLGASNVSDDERVPLNNYVTLDENDSGPPTGLGGPCNGAMFAFKYRQIWKLTATGDATQPYSLFPISKSVGAVCHRAIVAGEDEAGNAAIYFLSHRGPYRYGVNGLQYIGRNLEDRLLPTGTTSQMNLEALVPGWVRWFSDRRQVWFAYATTGFQLPTAIAVWSLGDNLSPSGWSIYTGDNIVGFCCAMFSHTVGAAMSRDLRPYIGGLQGTTYVSDHQLGKADTGTTDADLTYQASIRTRAVNPYWPKYRVTVQDVVVAAKAGSATVTVSVSNSSGVETRTETTSLAAVGSETRVTKRVGGDAQTAAAAWAQFTVGDATAVDNSWSIDGLLVSLLQADPLVS